MKSTLILALAGSAVAAPSFSSVLEALFGGGDNSNDNRPSPSDFPGFPPFGSGSGVPFPFPTATGAPFPTGTSGALPFPLPGSGSQEKRDVKALHIDYALAEKAAPVVKRRELKYRQLSDPALPSFSLLDPNDTPSATAPATGLPTEVPTELPGVSTGVSTGTAAPGLPSAAPTDLPGLPTVIPTYTAGEPTAPFPTGAPSLPSGTGAPFPPAGTGAPFPPAGTGAPFPPAGTGAPGSPSLPTTFGTVTRGPQPTAAPSAPAQDGDETENGNAWLEWITDLLTGGRGSRD